MADTPKAPAGLKRDGKALWRAVLGAYELEEQERGLLLQACLTLDLCADLQAMLDAEGPVVVDAGRSKAHPCVVELRQHRIVYARLVAALRIPLDDAAGRTQARGVRGVYAFKGEAS